jgi:hypothetical protein
MQDCKVQLSIAVFFVTSGFPRFALWIKIKTRTSAVTPSVLAWSARYCEPHCCRCRELTLLAAR